METRIKKLLIVGTTTLLLGACANTSEDEVAKKNVKAEIESVEEETNVNESYFVDQIETSINFKTTPLPELSEEELELADQVMSKLNEASTPKPGEEPVFKSDRGFIETFADEFPEHTVDELVDVHYKAGEYRMYKTDGDEYISPNDMSKALESNLEANLRPDLDVRTWSLNSGEYNFNDDYTVVTYKAEYTNHGERVPVKMKVEFDQGDYSTGELLELSVDGEDALE